MTVKVEVRDGERLQEALRRFRHAVRHAYRRQWYKTRVGSYDKPSYRRRRRETLRKRNRSWQGIRPGRYFTVYVGLEGLYSRKAPFTYPRKPPKESHGLREESREYFPANSAWGRGARHPRRDRLVVRAHEHNKLVGMGLYYAEKVELEADTDNGEGWVEFQWADSLYGWECLKIDLDMHCSRRMPVRSGDGLPDLVELQRDRIKFHFDPSLAGKLQLEQDVEIAFDISENEFSGLRKVTTYLFGRDGSGK